MTEQQIQFSRSPGGTRIAFSTTGAGTTLPSLVRAAHWLGSLDFDGQTPVWAGWIEALARRHRLTRYDCRGCGLSDRDVDDFSLDVLVADLESVVDSAGLKKFALLGMSQGGAVSIAYAARHPERVSHLVLCGAFARGTLVRNPSDAQRELFQAMTRLVELGWGQDNPAFLQMFTSQFFPNATPAQAHAFNEIQRRATQPGTAARLMRAFADLDASPALSQIRVPTLVLHSRGDNRVPLEEGRFLAASIPGARFEPLDSTSHVPLPGEPAFVRLHELLQEFLVPNHTGEGAFPLLTPREHQVLNLVAGGLDNAQIAAHLTIADKTVRNHITAIFEKLEVENRPQAIVRARLAGLGELGASSPGRQPQT
ncbi:MAG: alpha/beta fold hydrolase [Polaromonas sp.]|nr:alpha/beta fold hydrolase [Polaromonas sp.]MDP3356820.1 alpha/beta fold hydrolase [Polaromonas sp.]MDP3752217.1 alpha/beta fold hydrolase [Polaromonas sp.]